MAANRNPGNVFVYSWWLLRLIGYCNVLVWLLYNVFLWAIENSKNWSQSWPSPSPCFQLFQFFFLLTKGHFRVWFSHRMDLCEDLAAYTYSYTKMSCNTLCSEQANVSRLPGKHSAKCFHLLAVRLVSVCGRGMQKTKSTSCTYTRQVLGLKLVTRELREWKTEAGSELVRRWF